jgi:hypothetical protein
MSTSVDYKYFIYSKYQHDMRVEVDKKINKVFSPGKVLVKGTWVPYTTLTNDPNTVNFPDAKIVIEGNINEIKYQEPTSIWGAL